MRKMKKFTTFGLAVLLAGACGGEKQKAPAKGGKSGMDPLEMKPRLGPRRAPARPQGGSIAAILAEPGNDDARYKALDRFVKEWPRSKAALPAVMKLLREDASIRGGVALSVARLGKPLALALVAMVRKAPQDKSTLLAAGVTAYHLVTLEGLTKRSDAEREAIRAALKPLHAPLWAAFMADRRPDYEIYQGVAVAAGETLAKFRPPIPEGGLSRVAMVLHLVLANKKDEAFLPRPTRDQLRKQVLPLAPLFAKALSKAKADGSGESPDSLVLGLAVLGESGAKAVAKEPGLRSPQRCGHVVKALANIYEQAGAGALKPAKTSLQKCINLLPDAGLTQQAKKVLEAVEKGK